MYPEPENRRGHSDGQGLSTEGRAPGDQEARSLADFLSTERDEIIRRWYSYEEEFRAKYGCSSSQLLDSAPDFLDALSENLRAPVEPSSIDKVIRIAHLHGVQRFELGFKASDVLREYGRLREAIFNLAIERGAVFSKDDELALHRYIDAGAAESIERYSVELEHARIERPQLLKELEAIFESFPDAIYVGGPDGIYRANRVALEQLGYESIDDLNRNIGTLAREIQTRRADTGEPISAEDQAFTHALQGQPDIQEVIVKHLKSGEDRVVRASCAPIYFGDKVTGAVAINTDITEKKALERQLREKTELAQQIIGIVSHDLRNPLSAILLGAQTLLHRESADENILKIAIRIQAQSERAIRMVYDLLDFTQARVGGQIPVALTSVDVCAVISSVVEELEIQHSERRIEFEPAGNCRLVADADRLAQVAANLIINALTYGDEGSPVKVSLRGDTEHVVMAVHNEGPPIPEDIQRKLFRPMQRGEHRRGRSSGNLGLGLFIVDEIVRAHGGRVDVESSEAEGTVFTVTLPRGRPVDGSGAADHTV